MRGPETRRMRRVCPVGACAHRRSRTCAAPGRAACGPASIKRKRPRLDSNQRPCEQLGGSRLPPRAPHGDAPGVIRTHDLRIRSCSRGHVFGSVKPFQVSQTCPQRPQICSVRDMVRDMSPGDTLGHDVRIQSERPAICRGKWRGKSNLRFRERPAWATPLQPRRSCAWTAIDGVARNRVDALDRVEQVSLLILHSGTASA